MMPEIIEKLVTTIIPVRNRPEMIVKAVESVLDQTYRPVEIIIVDDGSTDSTPMVCRDLESRHPDLIRFVRQQHSGAGPAREQGRQLARGEFIQYLDSDDRLLPNKFSDQVTLLENHPECGVAYGMARLVNTTGEVLAEPFKWTGRSFSQLFPALLVDRWWCTHTPLYRRSVCDRVGAWSDLRYSQDWEYDARIGALQTQLVSTKYCVSEHLTHSETRQTGHGKWLEPSGQVKFFTSLFQSARQACVSMQSPEMQHFSRWLFAAARDCAIRGDADAARSLMRLSIKASIKPDIKMKLVSALVKILGWRMTGMIIYPLEKFRANRAGPGTLRQSWMDSSQQVPCD